MGIQGLFGEQLVIPGGSVGGERRRLIDICSRDCHKTTLLVMSALTKGQASELEGGG